MVDFGEMARRAKREAEAHASAEATKSAEKSDAGTVVLRERVLPMLRKAHEEINKSKTGISCSIESKFEPEQKSIVVFTCVGLPVSHPNGTKSQPFSVSLLFESDGTTIDAREKYGGMRLAHHEWTGYPVQDADELIEKAVDGALRSYYKLPPSVS